jgi:hypothetical protein
MRTSKALLLVLLLVGAGFTTVGAVFLFSYTANYHDNLGTISTNILAGWSSKNVTNPSVTMTMFPQNFPNGTAQIILRLGGFVFTNSSEVAVFSFVSPYVITSQSVEFDQSDLNGQWSVVNIGNNASAVYYTIKLTDCSFIPCSGSLNTAIALNFDNLLYRDAHGQYTVVVPFGEGESPWLINHSPNYTSFLNDLTTQIQFQLYLTTGDTIVSSFPAVTGEETYSYAGQGPAIQEFLFGRLGSTLTVTYNNLQEVDTSNGNFSFALFFLGIGIPLLVSALFESYRDTKSRPHSQSSRCQSTSDFGGLSVTD